jgi:hypothetical protein
VGRTAMDFSTGEGVRVKGSENRDEKMVIVKLIVQKEKRK